MNFVPIVIGILIIVFRKFLAKQSMSSQNKFWGFRFGSREVKVSEYVAIIVGSLFVLIGIYDLVL